MRTRIVVVVLAACILCPASHAVAQWTPRKIVRAPLQRGPVRSPSYYGQRGPVQFRRANTSGPIVSNPITPHGGPAQYDAWRNFVGDVGYKSYDAQTSDSSRTDAGGVIPKW